jgi:formylglycine-generating enzyme required for sulfatase activity/uncharacterized caspase-like protein
MPIRLLTVIVAGSILFAQTQADKRVVVPSGRPRRLALVVGIESYSPTPLVNPLNDARAIAASLRDNAFFEVTEVENADSRKLETAVNQFTASLRPGDVALFYYSGHGMQIEGENYLVPVDFSAQDEVDAKRMAYSAQAVHDKMAGAGASLSILILDACRDNPFRATRGGTHGWAAMQTGKGSFIAFATAPGATASDNPRAKNGLFTEYLLQSLAKPGLGINQVFDEATEAVYQASGGKQAPWVAKSVVGSFVFRDPALEEARYAAAQAELKRLEAAQAAAENAARVNRANTEAANAAAAAKAKVEQQRLETERLSKESERAKELEAERARIEGDLAAQAKERERQRLETEARLATLRANAPVAGNSDMTLEQARARVAELQKKIEELRAANEAAKAEALKKLSDDYAPVRASLAPAKGEFETTGEYQARLASLQKQRQALENRFASDRAQIDKQYSAEFESATLAESREIQSLKQRTYPFPARLVWDSYNADDGRLTVAVDGRMLLFDMPVEKARRISARKDSLAISIALETTTGESPTGVFLIDTTTGDRFEPPRSRVNRKDGLAYVWISPGSFRMGCSNRDGECDPVEGPARDVTISKGFWIGQTEVTQAAYERVMGQNPSHFRGERLPVETVRWDEAKSYCEAVSGRLPTEAEWEYAARGGTNGPRYGDLDQIAWYDTNSGNTPHPVAQKAPNPYGLYDMLGNVREWTADWNDQANARSLRGGSWFDFPHSLRVSFRIALVGDRGNSFGLRCVMD